MEEEKERGGRGAALCYNCSSALGASFPDRETEREQPACASPFLAEKGELVGVVAPSCGGGRGGGQRTPLLLLLLLLLLLPPPSPRSLGDGERERERERKRRKRHQ